MVQIDGDTALSGISDRGGYLRFTFRTDKGTPHDDIPFIGGDRIAYDSRLPEHGLIVLADSDRISISICDRQADIIAVLLPADISLGAGIGEYARPLAIGQ